MRGRVLGLTAHFLRQRSRFVVAGTPAAQALAGAIARLISGDLPGPNDAETLVPPVRQYWFRRVAGQNLWILFTFSDEQVTLRALLTKPPTPL